MAEPARELQEALGRMASRWDAARTERTLEGLPARQQRRRARAVAAAAAMAGMVALALVAVRPPRVERDGAADAGLATSQSTAPAALSAGTEGARDLRLADGSRVRLLDDGARVVTERVSRKLVALGLQAGRARFDVAPDPARLFRVHSGVVTVEVLGTAFELTRRGAQTRVVVEHGRVAVRWGQVRRELHAGESGWFPPAPAAGAGASGEDGAAAVGPEAVRSQGEPGAASETFAVAARRARRAANWREHAEQGEFKRAYQLLQRPDVAVAPEVGELMLAADAARLSGHPAQAVPYLRQVIDGHPGDARAPLAAFTLGGVLMNQLGLPREAEAAYATARKGTQSAALAQDALARQVEAASRAGDEVLARGLAERYLREYPDGRRVQAVRRFGSL